jgi:hypothetical protein
MINIDRLKMEIKGVNITDEEIIIYLQENDLKDTDTYDPNSKTNLKNIYRTALSILESIANNPTGMKNYKTEDISITHFQNNLMQRIDYLNRKIRLMPDDDDISSDGGATLEYMFKE